MRRNPFVLLGLTAALLPLAGCGGDDDSAGDPPPGPPPDGVVTVVAESVSGFDSDSYEAPPGEVTIRFENPDSIPHTVAFDDEDFKLTDDGEEGSIELDAGEYTLYCDVPGHREAGMEATLTIG